MSEGTMKFCSLCDPKSISAIEYCTDCDEFLCIECVKPHQASKHLKTHSRLSVENYEKLPSFVKEIQHSCQEHEEKLDSFCPVHSIPCCLRCVLTTHKTCEGVKPLIDFLSNSKNSPIIHDLEQTVNDLCVFVEKSIADRKLKKEKIKKQKENIITEIKALKTTIISRLDELEENLYQTLNLKYAKIDHDIDVFVGQLQDVSQEITAMKEESRELVEHASNLQTFLCLPELMSSVSLKEMEMQSLLNQNERPCNKSLYFKADIYLNEVKTMGNINETIDDRLIQYRRSKEKQAQILGPRSKEIGTIVHTQDRIVSKIWSIYLTLKHSENVITSCDVSKDGKIIIAEYNSYYDIDRVCVFDLNGTFQRVITEKRLGSIYDVIIVSTEKVAFSSSGSLRVVGIDNGRCFIKTEAAYNSISGVASDDNDVIYATVKKKGICKFNVKTGKPCELLHVEERNFALFSYIAHWNGKLFYTLGKGQNVVRCCDAEQGNLLWTFEDTHLLRCPRALTVDKDGFIFVVGHSSNNIVVITEDGKQAKELVTCSEPTAICYMKDGHQLLVIDQRNRATIYQILNK